jgi:alpha-tubulin suppressor-like RCC1 family protein
MTPRTKRKLTITAAIITFALLCYLASFRPSNSRLPTGPLKPKVALGMFHGVILASDGSLWTWGECKLGWHALGLGPNIQTQPRLQQIGTETNWIDVAVGGSTTIALKSDGSIWGWGYNMHGQVNANAPRDQSIPIRAVPGNDWKQVASANDTLALKRDGTLWAWGDNWAGVFGNGTTNSSSTPAQVGSSTNWSRIWADGIQNVAQQNDGSLWFWGWDYTTSEKGSAITVPTRISPDTNWIDVGMGEWMVFAIKSDGTLWTWGRHAHFYSTATNASQDSFPVQVGHDTDWRSCANFGSPAPLFIKRDGTLWVLDKGNRRGFDVVTRVAQGLITNNQLNCMANSSDFYGDPQFDVLKTLRVTCQINGKTIVTNFPEYSPVNLSSSPEQPLIITRALYGDPKTFGEADKLSDHELVYQPARLHRIDLNKNIVAFCGGRHQLGVALTADGEVWEWGETLGQPKYPFLARLRKLAKNLGLRADWDDAPLVLENPTKLSKSQNSPAEITNQTR